MSINLLLLGPLWRNKTICQFLSSENISYFLSDDCPSPADCLSYSHLITSGYDKLVPSSVLSSFSPLNRLNIHATFLPFGKGIGTALFGTLFPVPFGSSIHVLDPTFDTGDIIVQSKFAFSEFTFRSQRELYDFWVNHASSLFIDNFHLLISGRLTPFPQTSEYCVPYMSRSESELILSLLSQGWDTDFNEINNLSLAFSLRLAN